MHINDIFKQHSTTFSFEFFPPKTAEASEKLFATIRQLEKLKPSFVSVTYGAGGSSRQLTHDLVIRIARETSLDPISHLTCISHSEQEIRHIIERYAQDVSNILVLAGDPPPDKPNYDRSNDTLAHAADLVRHITQFNQLAIHSDPRGFGIGVAGFPEGHPATPNRMREMDYLKAKVDRGAHYICTQLFFDNHMFYDFSQRCELAGIGVPIIAGIMPITSLSGMKRMAQLASGVRFPAALLRAVGRAGDDPQAVRRVGLHWATEQCRDLLDHQVQGLHFYTLNRSDATQKIYENLGVQDSMSLRNVT